MPCRDKSEKRETVPVMIESPNSVPVVLCSSPASVAFPLILRATYSFPSKKSIFLLKVI